MNNPTNHSFWQRYARLYTHFVNGHSRLYREVGAQIRPHLNRSMNVLELACGTGRLSRLLCPQVQLWEATDFSGAMIAEARKSSHSSRLHFSVQDATNLPYASETFDAVLIANALHIMPHPEKALAEIHRVLKPEGLLFAPTFLSEEGRNSLFTSRLMEAAGFQVYFPWDAASFANYINNHGFSVITHPILENRFKPLCCLTAKKTASKETAL